MNPHQIVRNLVKHALEHTEGLTLPAKADLYEAAALVLNGDEAAEASHTAELLRRAEEAQIKFNLIIK